jgi:azurin
MKSKLAALLVVLAVAAATLLTVHAADSGPAAPRIVKVRAGVGNAMKFDVTSITAAPGESLKIVLTNASTLPKEAMGHNWILLTAGTDPVKFAEAAASEGKAGYIPAKMKDKIVAYVGLLGPNETGEVTFAAPTEPGEYPFLCSFPAHCFVGMKGVLTVK